MFLYFQILSKLSWEFCLNKACQSWSSCAHEVTIAKHAFRVSDNSVQRLKQHYDKICPLGLCQFKYMLSSSSQSAYVLSGVIWI